MKIAILTLAIGDKFRQKTRYAIASQIEYCKKHGYDFIDDETVYDTSRPVAWSKILLIKKYLPNYDYVVWIDADAMIVDLNQRIEDKIILFNNKDVCVTAIYGMINTGVILVKNTEKSLRLMDLIYEQTQFIEAGNWDQESFIYIYENNLENMRDHIEVKQDEFQKLQCYLTYLRPGFFIVHLAGFRTIDWTANKIFERLYPLQRDNESEEHYRERMEWYNTKLEESIKGFYNTSAYDLLEHPV